MKNEINLESIIFSYIEQFKFLIFPDQWSSVFMDFSKNELLALIYLYRYRTSNMTDIAQFINSPLNTATGVITRLEKKEMVVRIRSSQDRRIVQLALTEKASRFIDKKIGEMGEYLSQIERVLTPDEKKAAVSIINKVSTVLMDNKSKTENNSGAKKIRKIEIE